MKPDRRRVVAGLVGAGLLGAGAGAAAQAEAPAVTLPRSGFTYRFGLTVDDGQMQSPMALANLSSVDVPLLATVSWSWTV